MRTFFVTGTDTSVGKTICSRAIIQVLQEMGTQIVGFKPIACGQDEPVYADSLDDPKNDYGDEDNRDVLVLQNSTKENVSYRDINSYTFLQTVPMITAEKGRIKLDKIDQDLARLTATYDAVAVEGSFGWLSPMNERFTFGDWVAKHKMPVIVAVGIKEGCINHALLTVQSIENMGLPVLGWIANRINPGLGHYAEIIDLLSSRIAAPLLGCIPYIHKPETQDVGKFLTNVEQLRHIQALLAK
ncbi:dethiobiotin synthase [Bisgaard Taxon 10/6]|uniref:ATP-dependent dethiobiotin synthetase BioD n=1 Tax=Exercitatus varius TaxID=67857 RepID=A0AAW6QEG1_9PAST|nr:dethiobiotin synthase [Exercitatus varius]MDG2948615.1 dethiobiotin synthase [Exercitatus varius]MDG2950757.1 dethiobiotin synthase [Exercitatus varius]